MGHVCDVTQLKGKVFIMEWKIGNQNVCCVSVAVSCLNSFLIFGNWGWGREEWRQRESESQRFLEALPHWIKICRLTGAFSKTDSREPEQISPQRHSSAPHNHYNFSQPPPRAFLSIRCLMLLLLHGAYTSLHITRNQTRSGKICLSFWVTN